MMPLISRVMIRLAFLYLFVGVLIGSLMMIQKVMPFWEFIWILRPIHIEMLIMGWIIQFKLGTAYWMLPRLLGAPKRGPELPGWIMVFALNLGIVLMMGKSVVSIVLASEDSIIVLTTLLGVTGRILQLLAVGLFVSLHWKRVVTYRYLDHSH
jgi:hypothetical protein